MKRRGEQKKKGRRRTKEKERTAGDERNRSRKNQHLDAGKTRAPGKPISIHSIMEASVRTGETIKEDWDTTSERETRIKEECEKIPPRR